MTIDLGFVFQVCATVFLVAITTGFSVIIVGSAIDTMKKKGGNKK